MTVSMKNGDIENRVNTREAFPWNKNVIVDREYKKDNYYLINTFSPTKKAIVFFSSNGIYFPNTEDTFIKVMNSKNHGYEWTNIARNKKIRKTFEKIMFVRDIYKQWYVTGINKRYDTIDKVVELIRQELSGFSITTCGVSSGGYMAVIIGSLVGAERIVCSSGQFDLLLEDNPGPIVEENRMNAAKVKYYDLRPYIEKKPIIYLYPAESQQDIDQYNLVKDKIDWIFAVQGKVHGSVIDAICYPALLTMPEGKIVKLANKYCGYVTTKKEFREEILSVSERIQYIMFRWYTLIRNIVHQLL